MENRRRRPTYRRPWRRLGKSRPNRLRSQSRSDVESVLGRPCRVSAIADYYRQYMEGPDFRPHRKRRVRRRLLPSTGGPTRALAAPVVASLPLSYIDDELEVFEKYIAPMSSCTLSCGDVHLRRFSAPSTASYADEIFIVPPGKDGPLWRGQYL